MACAMSCGRTRAVFSLVKAGTALPTATATKVPTGIGGEGGTSAMHGEKDTVNQSALGRGNDKTLRENGFLALRNVNCHSGRASSALCYACGRFPSFHFLALMT